MILNRSQHSHFLGVSWTLQEMYKASGSILLLIKMDFDQFQNQKTSRVEAFTWVTFVLESYREIEILSVIHFFDLDAMIFPWG